MHSLKWQTIVIKNLQTKQFLFNLSNCRSISISQVLKKSYYDALGITPKATQSDIKSAYYKLSMLYHPDKNKSSDAADKFRDITAAYEVLGNFTLRKLYDKGILTKGGSHETSHSHTTFHDEAIVEDDPQTKFYKAHMRKKQAPHAAGRTPIYDFDEWSRNHYNEAFTRNQSARKRFRQKEEQAIFDKGGWRKEVFVFGVTFIIFIVLLINYSEIEHDMNRVHIKKKDKS